MNIRVQKISLLFVTERKETSVQLFKAAIILSVRTMNVHYIYFYFHLARNRFINMWRHGLIKKVHPSKSVSPPCFILEELVI